MPEALAKLQKTPPLVPADAGAAAAVDGAQLALSSDAAAPVQRTASAPSSAAAPAPGTALEPPPGLTKAERAEWFKKNLPTPAPKDKKPQQKTPRAGDDTTPPSVGDAGGGEGAPVKPKVTGKPSTGNLAGVVVAVALQLSFVHLMPLPSSLPLPPQANCRRMMPKR